MIQSLYPLSRGRSRLLIFILLSSLSRYLHAQNGSVTTTQSFSYTGQIVTWTVPAGVTSLTIEARGAEGGDIVNRQASAGKGAIVAAQVSVTPGQSLSVLVGQSLNGRSAGGGGAFVAAPGSAGAPIPLVIAGGGGGASTVNGNTDAKHGQAATSGGNGGFAFSGNNNNPGAGGTNGGGGGSGANGAGGGGGFTGNGVGNTEYPNAGGRSFTNGGAGGSAANGGSYGGGGSTDNGNTSGGGGGGYSGGGAGYTGVGGGGGSFTAGTRLFARTGNTDGNSGNGLVIISYTTQIIRYIKQGGSGTGDGTSWANASGDLQSQINISGAQQVWVAGGRYTTTQNSGSFLMKNNVAIYGGFTGSEQNLTDRPAANPVVGQISSTTMSIATATRSVISNSTLGLTAVLDGVVLTGGGGPDGGGIFNQKSSPTLINCLISNNSTTNNGGGVFNTATSNPSFTNCVITNNSATKNGGGVYNDGNSNPSFTNCVIANNSATKNGGGVYNDGNSNPSFTNCVIANNSANQDGGGIFSNQSQPTLLNCLIRQNSAGANGGGVLNFSSNPRLTNCTLTANRATGRGSAVSNFGGGQTTLVNAILFDNQESPNSNAIYNDGSNTTTANYCLIGLGESDFTGSNNVVATTSPFVSGTDYRLRAGSPAIDAGDPNSSSGATDLGGNPRIANGRIDIGVYEYQGPFCHPIAITQQPASTSNVTLGSTVSTFVTVSGDNPTYQWYKGSTALSNQTSATLTLTNVQTSDAGSYSLVITGACNSLTSTAFSLNVGGFLTALYQTGDLGKPTDNFIKPNLQLINASGQPIPYSEITIRYWFTPEGDAPSNFSATAAQLGAVNLRYVALATPRQGAYGYLEYSFPGGGSLAGGGTNSGSIESSVQKADGSNFDETDDWSYQTSNNYTDNAHVTVYRNGTLISGTEPPQVASRTAVQVYSQALSTTPTTQLRTRLELRNTGNVALPVSDLVLNYYFTTDNGQIPNIYVENAAIGTATVRVQVVKLPGPITGADAYISVSFPSSSRQLAPGSSLGNIDLGLVRSDNGSFDQSNDYSYSGNTSVALNNRVPAYLNNRLIFGTPPAGAPASGGGNCTDVAGITSQPPSNSSVTVGSNVSLPVSTSGSVNSYQWYKDGFNPVVGQTTATLSLTNVQLSDAGSYSLVASGCNWVASMPFNLVVTNQTTTLTGFAATPTSACVGSPVNFTATVGNVTGSYGYTLTNGMSSTTGTATSSTFSQVLLASGTGPQTFTLTVSSNGQLARTTTTLTVNAPPVATLTASPSTVLSCGQTSLTLTAGGGTGYVFSGPGIVSQNGNQAVVNTPGSYSVTVTSSGCSSTTSIVISQDNTTPTASLASSGTLSCSATSVTLTASPGGQSYRFSDGATPIGTTNQATVTTAGIYSVTVISGNGCSSVASTTVTGDQTVPSVSITPTSGTLTCASPTLTLTANTNAPTLRWSNGQTTPSITVNTAGTYSVTATGANGCSATSNAVRIESSQSAPPATLMASGGLSCAVTSVTLTANTGNGLSYRFSPGATQVGNGNTATVNVAGTYSVTVTNTATGCTNTASIVVNQDNSQPTVTINPTSASLTCGVPSVTLTATTSAPSIRWSTGQTTASISVSVAGTYSVTVTSANGCMAMAQATVSGTTEAPAVPTLSANPATTTTNQSITVTASGCAGGTTNWTALGGTGQANGNTYTLTQPGNYTLSATCSLNGCTSSSSAPLSVQIRPGGFAITGVNMVNCQLTNPSRGEYQVQFTPQYTGQTSNPVSFAVVNELAPTTAPAPYSLRLYTDNPVITLVATQAGNGEARFAYNWLASCQSGTSPNQPPTTTGIPSQTIVQGQGYQLQLTTYFSDPDGQALTFQASGLPTGLSLSGSVISGTPSQTGVSTVNVTAIDPGGLPVSTSFQLTVTPMPVTPPTGFAIVGASTVSCQVLSAGERRLIFTPQYAGVSGAPISFSVVNELVATTSPGPYSLNLYTDNPSITLSAQQGATVSTYRYNWLAVCSPAARVGSGEVGSRLQVRVLGNPVAGNTAEVEISGVTGQSVQLNLVNLQGKLVHAQRIEQAQAMERVSLPLGASNGVLLLHVSTPTQRQQIKLLRTN